TARTGGVGGDLDVDVLAAAPSALRGRALHAALIGWGCPAGSVLTTHVDALDALVTRWHGQGGASVPGGTVARRCGRLAFNANQGAATGGSFGHG
ncbi:MAG: hypothetical protein HGA44_16190, partial [Cellulomonadaceae bacterium]|nr:hypothetical protein [Cellulomonadaceae bacterium]